jgi:hypothetical protein
LLSLLLITWSLAHNGCHLISNPVDIGEGDPGKPELLGIDHHIWSPIAKPEAKAGRYAYVLRRTAPRPDGLLELFFNLLAVAIGTGFPRSVSIIDADKDVALERCGFHHFLSLVGLWSQGSDTAKRRVVEALCITGREAKEVAPKST